MHQSWQFPALIADIGGTNARFALLIEQDGLPQHVQTLPCANYPDIVAAIETYLGALTFVRPRRAAIAMANPVTGDAIKMMNHHWNFSTEETRQRLKLDTLRVINDFTALALALPRLSSEEQVQVGGGEVKSRCPIGLIGPGTGLGVSGLIPFGKNGWQPLSGEGGHADFSPVNEEEDAVLRQVRKRHSRVSCERLISGPGLINVQRAVSELAGVSPEELTPAEISSRALSGEDPLCIKALQLFCAMLGGAAGNLALTLGSEGGVYIGGGIVPGILDFFLKSPFRERFETKGRLSGYLKNIPTFVITAKNPALLGMAALLQQA